MLASMSSNRHVANAVGPLRIECDLYGFPPTTRSVLRKKLMRLH
jgi:hypothetical protein